MLDALLATLTPANFVQATTAPPPARQVIAQQPVRLSAKPTTDAPAKLPPESKPAAIAPTAAETPPVVTATPTPARTSAPAPTPSATPSLEPEAAIAGRTNAKAEQLKRLEQKLATIVARDKSKKQEQLRRSLPTIAIQQAQAGQVQQARQTARDMLLSPAEQAELLTQINQIRGSKPSQDRAKTSTPSVPVAKLPRSQQPGDVNRTPSKGYIPSYVLPNISQAPGLGHTRLLQPTWQLGNGNLRLIFPLPIPTLFSSGFGWRNHPITGDRRFHRGVDLAAALGTPVVAAFSGVIEAADWMDGYGLTVLIAHPNSTQTLYAHLSEIFVKPGDRITQGQPIGRVGSTGNSTGPHLHFELHQLTATGWEAIDPELALEVARLYLVKVLQDPESLLAANPPDPAKSLPALPQNFGAIPPAPTQKFPILHNF